MSQQSPHDPTFPPGTSAATSAADLKACLLPGRSVVRMTGTEARDFLQGLVSNDVMAATAERAVYALLLTPQGRWRHDMTLLTQGDELLLESATAGVADLLATFARYRLRSRVDWRDEAAQWQTWAVWGPGAAGSWGLAPEPGSLRQSDQGLAWVDPRHAALGVRLLRPADGPGLSDSFPGTLADYEALRLSLGVPESGHDLIAGETLPLEVRLDEFNAISWSKGCYLGQEITARFHHRRLARRRLVPVAVNGPLPSPGTPVLQDGVAVGELCSGHGTLALALLSCDVAEPGQALSAGAAALVVRSA